MTVAKAVDDLTKALRRLPGVGPKTAQRYVFQLLARDRKGATEIVDTLQKAVESVRHCSQCNNFSESPVCSICDSPARDRSQLCIVETPADLNSFEEAGVYQGLYFVLMGKISPMDGIGPDDLNIDELLDVLKSNPVNEIILAMNITLEGDATADYLSERMTEYGCTITRLARGLPLGGELEYMDKGTLIEAFQRRVPN
ncbi:MAG: recombination mediator RecR [Acidiferrobacterales bacterium]|nr:recombination mediator RecR [Acidiferrobacterales bacterium]